MIGSDEYKLLSHWFDSTKVREVQIRQSSRMGDGCSSHLGVLILSFNFFFLSSLNSLIERNNSIGQYFYSVH